MKKLLLILALTSLFILTINAQHFANYQVYIWDDDFGYQFPDPDGLEPVPIGYEQNLIKAFEGLGFDETNLRTGTSLPVYDELITYAAVFIVMGNAIPGLPLMTWESQELLQAYLDYGGCIYLEGNNAAEFFALQGSSFLAQNFNIDLEHPGIEQSGYDTLITDPAGTFMNDYTFLFPTGTAADNGIDRVKPRDALGPPYFYDILLYNTPDKLYKSAASAYTPPEGQKDEQVKYKTFFSTVSLGAFSYPHEEQGKESLPDSVENQFIRSAYVSDILRWFGLAQTLVVDYTGNKVPRISEALKGLGIDNENIFRNPGQAILRPVTGVYNTIIMYTGAGQENVMPQAMIDTLTRFMSYGGDVFIFGENIAQAIGTSGDDGLKPWNEHPLLTQYFGVDYLQATFANDKHHSAADGSFYRNYSYSTNIGVEEGNPDLINTLPTLFNNPFPAYYFNGSLKAPAISGVFNDKSHRSMFLSFMLETAAQANLDTVLAVTMVDYFGYDTLFDPLDKTGSTAIMEVNAYHILRANTIDFIINAENCITGNIQLMLNNELIAYEEISKAVQQSIITVPYLEGNYVLSVNSMDRNVYSRAFSIFDSRNDEISIGADGYLSIEAPAGEMIDIYDVTGKKVLSAVSSGSNVFPGFKNLGSGMYFAGIGSSDNKRVYKFVKL